jgi:ABC-type transporter Mla MlaB component
MKQRKQAMPSRTIRRGRAARGSQEPAARARAPLPTVFQIAAECTVADAGTLCSGLEKLLKDPGVVKLDISAIQRIDTAGLQVIGAFARERAAQQLPVAWQGDSAAFASAAKLLGLTALLGLPELQG